MFDEMKDVAIQLALKWARYGPQHRILAPDDFTRLTLDTISLCSMGFRFNSFYAENLHPFVEAMGDFLVESGKRSQRIPLPSIFYRASNAKFHQDIETMRKTAEAVLRQRVSEPDNDRNDLLSTMLRGRDPKTGQKMSDESIIDNIITFLIAGHETTSGLLSYATVGFHEMGFNDPYILALQSQGFLTIDTGHAISISFLITILRTGLVSILLMS